jgi:hypothetical protein
MTTKTKRATKHKQKEKDSTVMTLRLPGYLNSVITGMASEEERTKGSVVRRLLREALNLPKPPSTKS